MQTSVGKDGQLRPLPGIPDGRDLRPADWLWRHRVVSLALAPHLPLLVVLDLASGRADRLPVLVVVAALLAAAASPVPRRARALSAAAGLLTSSALVADLTGTGAGAGIAALHLVIVVALLSLYADWAVLALAVVFSLAHRGLVDPFGDAASASAPAWGWALLHAGLVVVECTVLVLVWRAARQGRWDEEQRLRAELSAGRTDLQEQLAAADQMRADLIATVSHEFRTPLTGIRGSALTLLKRGDRLDKNGRDRLLHAVLDQQERLSRLLENMLLAAQATDADPSACAEVDAVAAEVAMLASASRPGAQGISVVVAPGTLARIDRQALHQVLANLLDNALLHGESGQTPIVAGGEDERGVWVTVSNEGRVIDLTARERIFEPFTQADSSATRDREGIGVGLYVVRRLVEVYGGSVEAHSDSGWVTLQLRLQSAAPARRGRTGATAPGRQTPAPTRLPTP